MKDFKGPFIERTAYGEIHSHSITIVKVTIKTNRVHGNISKCSIIILIPFLVPRKADEIDHKKLVNHDIEKHLAKKVNKQKHVSPKFGREKLQEKPE